MKRDALAVVAGVAAAITVPRVVADRQPGPPPLAAPAPAASPAAKLTYPDGLFDGNLAAFTSGEFTVSGTVHVTPGYQVATIVGPTGDGGYEDAKGKTHPMPNGVGQVVVYRPGAFDPAKARTGEPVTIDGREGFYQDGDEPKPIKTPAGLLRPSSDATLSWEYADNAWAVVVVDSSLRSLRKQIEDVAVGVHFEAAQPVKVGFRLGYTPEGFELAAAGEAEGGLSAPLDGQSYVRLLKGDFPYRGLTEPVIDPIVVRGRPLPMIQLTVYPSWWTDQSPRSGQSRGRPFCAEPSLCYRYTDDGKFVVELNGGGAAPDSQLLRMLRELTFADPADRATWVDATEAVG